MILLHLRRKRKCLSFVSVTYRRVKRRDNSWCNCYQLSVIYTVRRRQPKLCIPIQMSVWKMYERRVKFFLMYKSHADVSEKLIRRWESERRASSSHQFFRHRLGWWVVINRRAGVPVCQCWHKKVSGTVLPLENWEFLSSFPHISPRFTS